MEEIYNKFACLSWLFIKEEEMKKISDKLNLSLISSNVKWRNSDKITTETAPLSSSNITLYEINRLIVSPVINGYILVEGKFVNYINDNWYSNITNDSFIYKFDIDIWIPTMSFTYYNHGKKIRECEYTLNEEGVVANEKGTKIEFEDKNLEIPSWEYGYDDFFYPLAIMEYWGVSISDIIKALNNDCLIYKINETIVSA